MPNSPRQEQEGVVFDVNYSKETKPLPKGLAKRLQGKQNVRTKEELEEKQKKAEERRKVQKEATVARAVEAREEIMRIDAKAQVLLQQDAKRRGIPGTENVKPMSQRQAASAVKDLQKDLSKLNVTPYKDSGAGQ